MNNVRPIRSKAEPRDEGSLDRGVFEAIRAAGLLPEHHPALPPPNDLEAEEALIGALLSREVSPAELGELSPADFYAPLHRWLFEKLEAATNAGIELTPQLLIASAVSEGIAADGIAREVEWLWSQPYVFPNLAREAAARIIELSRRRRLIAALDKIVFRLRADDWGCARSVAALRKLSTKVEQEIP